MGQIFIFRQSASRNVLVHKIHTVEPNLSVRKLWMGFQIFNLGHVTLTTPTLGVVCHPMANTCYVDYAYQI